MRQTNVCLNRVFNRKKETKKDKKTTGALYMVTREMRARLGITE